MKIDGKALADQILADLTNQVTKLKEQVVTPTLAVIQVGDDPGSTAYIGQKKKAANIIGAKIIHEKLSSTATADDLRKAIKKYNDDPSVHGLIVQRPLPTPLSDVSMNQYINIKKDVDGFLPKSPYPVPVAEAVLTILKEIYKLEKVKSTDTASSFDDWLKRQCSAVLGRGETAGKPIFTYLADRGCATSVIHSQTPDPAAITKKMTIVVSCVGKKRVITKDMVTSETILIGVGLWRDGAGKLRGDYDEEEIKDKVAYYTPTPGGVGPLNVACLMQNLVLAAQKSY